MPSVAAQVNDFPLPLPPTNASTRPRCRVNDTPCTSGCAACSAILRSSICCGISVRAPVKAGEQRLLGELTGAACATLVAEIAERHAGPVVLIAPDMQNALRLHDEISQFTDQMVMNLADWETLPYDSFSMGKKR